MKRRRNSSRIFALLNLAFYLLLLAGAGLLARPVLRSWWLFLRAPVAYLPTPPSPLWYGPLLLLLAATGTIAVGRALVGERPKRRVSLLFFLGFAGLVVVRLIRPLPPPPDPREAWSEARRAVLQLQQALSRHPTADPKRLVEGPSPYTRHGRPLPWTVVVEEGLGPRLTGRAGDGPATIYVVRGTVRPEIWITALALARAPTGPLRFLPDEEGRPLIARVQLRDRRRSVGDRSR